MKKRIISGYEAGKKIKGLWSSYGLDLNSVSELVEEKTVLDEELLQLEAAAAIQSTDISGQALSKKNLKKVMVAVVLKYALRARVKAHRAGNTGLEQELNHQKTYYLHSKAETAFSRAKATKEKIENNLGLLTNITVNNVTEMQKAIKAFGDIITKPTEEKQTKKVAGTDQLDVLSLKLDETITNIGDLIHSYFPDTLLSQEFDAKSKLGTTASRHNHLLLQLEDAQTDAPITDAKATNQKTNTSGTADSNGQIVFNTTNAGKQQFVIDAKGYIQKTIDVKVKRSTTTEIVVALDKEE